MIFYAKVLEKISLALKWGHTFISTTCCSLFVKNLSCHHFHLMGWQLLYAF